MSYFATTFLAAFIKLQKHLVLIERNLFQTRAFSVAGCCIRDCFNWCEHSWQESHMQAFQEEILRIRTFKHLL